MPGAVVFDGDSKNPCLPGNYIGNAVVYTATCDNPPCPIGVSNGCAS